MNFYYDKNGLITILDRKLKRGEVRQKIPLGYKEFVKSSFSKNTSDIFGNSEVLVTYDIDNILTGIELYNPEAKFYLQDKQMLGARVEDVLSFFEHRGIRYVINRDDLSIVIKEYNIEFFTPKIQEDFKNSAIESVYLTK